MPAARLTAELRPKAREHRRLGSAANETISLSVDNGAVFS
jgi:hypothetical protein